ncbi:MULTISPECIES: hypothetical protein [Spirulina sp. CCY15215]|uniref:hypothetical protein n=1 Tax=Spirulina sp. CCY15215 TaxID=2767591 RepID=UPI0019522E79|nr:hypothetical protein [Spirulina major]
MIGYIKKMLQGKSYYLEESSPSSANEPTVSAPPTEEKPEPVEAEAEKSEDVPAVEAETSKGGTKKSSQKKGKKKAVALEETVQPEAPAAVYPSTSDTLELIKAAVEKPTTLAQADSEEEGSTFAPDYLLYTKTQAKRRPGASMDSFLKMARQKR